VILLQRNLIYSLIVGIALYIVLIYLASVQRDLTLPQLILMLATPLAIGMFSGGIKKGAILAAVISFAMISIEAIVLSSGAASNPNVLLTIVIMMALPWTAISAGLGALGGLIGKRFFK
jgi:hypothetical protein